MADRDLGIGDLGGGGAVHLAHALPRRADTVHAGMHIAQSAAIGVERQLAARRGVAPGDEGAGLTARHKAQIFEAVKSGDAQRVADHKMVDVVVRDASRGKGLGAGDAEGARGGVSFVTSAGKWGSSGRPGPSRPWIPAFAGMTGKADHRGFDTLAVPTKYIGPCSLPGASFAGTRGRARLRTGSRHGDGLSPL